MTPTMKAWITFAWILFILRQTPCIREFDRNPSPEDVQTV